MPINPIGIKSDGSYTELDGVAVANQLFDVASLSAYAGTATSVLMGARLYIYSATTKPTMGRFVVTATGKGAGCWLMQADYINVKDFGALGNGVVDDSAAIQAAVDYAKMISVANGGNVRMQVNFPAGIYLISTAINCTNTTGLWLVGSESPYVTSQINGNTGGIMFDMTGGIMCGVKGFTFQSSKDFANPSRIAVQFALTAGGGLNCAIERCYFLMDNNTSWAGGLGSIAILNVRSEEFKVADCYIKAGSPIILSNQANLSPMGVTYTVSSPFATVDSATGSMGVVDFHGQMSVMSVDKYRPALQLLNANSIRFFGYLKQFTGAGTANTAGTNNTAIGLYGQADNINLSGNIEGFSQVCRYASLSRNIQHNWVIANEYVTTENLFDVTNCNVHDSRAVLTFNTPSEINNDNRVFVYHASTGTSPVSTGMQNCEWVCTAWLNNRYFVSPNILKNSSNCRFLTNQPFEKKNQTVYDLKDSPISLGLVSSGNPALTGTILRFTKGDIGDAALSGGFYRARIIGQVILGNLYQTGGNCVAAIEADVIVSQVNSGTKNNTQQLVSILAKSTTSASYLDITGASCNIDFTGTYPAVTLTVNNSGNGVNEPCRFEGRVELSADFYVNFPIPFA